jgi:hypothetical protein
MVQVLTFSIADPSWSVVNVSQKTIQAYAQKYMILKVGQSFGFVVFDMVGPSSSSDSDSDDSGAPYYIPSSFPFMLPLYRSPSLYVSKAKVSAKVPTGWVSDRQLAWKNMRLVSVAEDDIQTIQAQWQGLSIREAMQRVSEHGWSKTPLERDEGVLIGIGVVETLEDEIDRKEGYGGGDEGGGGGEETIDDWLEEEEIDEDPDGEGDADDMDDDEAEVGIEDHDDDEGTGDIDAEMPMDDGSNSEDGFEDDD